MERSQIPVQELLRNTYEKKKLVSKPQFKRFLQHNGHSCYCWGKVTSVKCHYGINCPYAIPDRHDTRQPVRYKITVKLSDKRSSLGYAGCLLHK